MKTFVLVFCALGAVAAIAVAGSRAPAAATAPPTALELVDRALSSAAGPDDEGVYNLIDPIGPGGARSTDAIAEVLASTFVAGRYVPWNYRDPFATPPDRGPGFPGRPPYDRDVRGEGR